MRGQGVANVKSTPLVSSLDFRIIGMEGAREPETAKSSLSDVPMRQSEIRGTWPADFDSGLLLHELPRSRTSVGATGFCAALTRFRQWNGHDPISKGSRAMHDGAAVS